MIRPELLRDIGDLANEELLFANQKFPLFSSPHEGYAVIKEEIEETIEDLAQIDTEIKFLWQAIRENHLGFGAINRMEKSALHCAAEAIQVAAMCRKYQDSLENKN